MNTREELILHLKNGSDVLREENLERAFTEIDRADFVPGDYLPEAYEDYSLPTLGERSILKPTIIAFMLELLELQVGESVLDVGAGSGFTTALAAYMVGEEGEVLGVEILEELLDFGKENLRKYSFPQVRFEDLNSTELGESSFDKIIFSAAVEQIPEKIIFALREDGLLVAPTEESIVLFRKGEDGLTEERSFPGFYNDNFLDLK